VNVSNQAPLADGLNSPTDLDGNSVFEDVSGNERLDFNDIVVLFENLRDAEAPFQDLNENGRIEFDDIVELLRRSEYIIKAGYHAT
jgi:PKD repeat protein